MIDVLGEVPTVVPTRPDVRKLALDSNKPVAQLRGFFSIQVPRRSPTGLDIEVAPVSISTTRLAISSHSMEDRAKVSSRDVDSGVVAMPFARLSPTAVELDNASPEVDGEESKLLEGLNLVIKKVVIATIDERSQEMEHQVEGKFLLDVVVGECSSGFREDPTVSTVVVVGGVVQTRVEWIEG